VDGAEQLVESEAVLHRQHVLGDQVAGMLADDGDAEDAVLPRHRQHLDEAVRLFVGDRAIEVVDAVNGDLVAMPAPSPPLVQADARDLRLGEGGPGNHRVVRAEALQRFPNSAFTAAYQAWCAAVWVNW
jgi:hypothetical protein